MSDSLLVAEGVAKHFAAGGGTLGRRGGVLRAVDGVSFALAAGETLGLVGESGCGKSTLGRLIVRLLDPTAGRILFEGEDVASLQGAALRARRRSLQIIFQDPYGALNPRMSVEEIVMEPLLIHGARPGAATRAEVLKMLELVGLGARALDRYPHEFSGGQRQRIGIARALVLHPRLVVCDEPVSALDVSVQAQIVNLLADLQGELGLTYLFIAHDLAVVKHIATRVAVMYLGKIVEIAEKRALYGAPLHPYTRALIAAVPAAHPGRRAHGRRRSEVASGDMPSALAPPPGCRFHTRCPHAQALCRETEPPLAEAAPGRLVACHFAAEWAGSPVA